jgi:hypothetical protein
MKVPPIALMKVFMPPAVELMPSLESSLYSGMVSEGTKVKEFEEGFQKFIGCKTRPLSVNSGTSALQLAYRCVGVKNKIVLATPMTCTATNMPIFAEGGKIVWCDIDPQTGNISVEDVRRKLKKYGNEVAAISFVDFAGYPADLTGLAQIREEFGVPLIEDAAQSIGALIDSPADLTCYSFNPVKNLGAFGDAGALTGKFTKSQFSYWTTPLLILLTLCSILRKSMSVNSKNDSSIPSNSDNLDTPVTSISFTLSKHSPSILCNITLNLVWSSDSSSPILAVIEIQPDKASMIFAIIFGNSTSLIVL